MIQDNILNSFNLKLMELDNFLSFLCNNSINPEHNSKNSNHIEVNEILSKYHNHLTEIRVSKSKIEHPNSKIELDKLLTKNKNSQIDKKSSKAIKRNKKRLRVSCDKLKKYKYFKTRRENIDKKLLRFMKIHIKESITIAKTPFLIDFIENKFNVPYNNGYNKFNSVSYSYLKFLHSNGELSKVYKDLMLNHFEFVFDSLINNYHIEHISDIESLKEYLTEYIDIYK